MSVGSLISGPPGLLRADPPFAGTNRIRFRRSAAGLPPSQPDRLPGLPQVHRDPTGRGPAGILSGMAFGTADGIGALRRERLRTARLYFVCDALPNGEEPEPLLRAALDGGVDIIQLREKVEPKTVIERSAQTFKRLADIYSVPFLLNDDPDLAVQCGADGVHIGQDDVSVADARAVVGDDMLIGLSTHSEEQIRAAEGTDYISVGPVWPTPTKEGRPAVGLDLVQFAARTVAGPFFAIGGIDTDNVPEILAVGARRLCVVRAIRDSRDPAGTAAALRRAFAAVGDEVAPGA